MVNRGGPSLSPEFLLRGAGLEEQRADIGTFLQEEAPQIGGAIIGGVKGGARGGLPGAVIGAAIGAAGGEAGGQLGRRVAIPLGREVETSAEAASEIGAAGVVGAAGEAGGFLLNKFIFKPVLSRLFGRTITPELRAATELKIPVTAGDISPGSVRQAVEGFISQTVLGKQAIRKFRLEKQLPEINRTIDEFVRQVSRVDLPPEQSGELLVNFLNIARRRVGENFDEAVRAIAQQAPDAAIQGETSLSKAAGEMLKKLRASTDEFSSLLGFEDLKRAILILEDFSKTGKTIETGVLSATGKPITRFVPRRVPIEKAINLRKVLFSVSNVPEKTIGKGTISQLNKALTESIGEALQQSSRPDLFADFIGVSKNFRFVMGNLEKRSIKQILNQESPEVIVDILLRKGSATRLKRIEAVLSAAKIPLSKLNAIRASAIRRIFDKASREIPISNAINLIEKQVGTPTLRKLLGGEEVLRRFRRFSGLLDSIGFSPELISPQAGGGGMGLAIGGAAGAVARPTAAPGALAFVSAVLGLPGILGRWFVNPKQLLTVEKVVSAELRRNGRAAALARLLGFVTASTISRGRKKLQPRFLLPKGTPIPVR